jgi:predicted DNA-binding protein (MmcQ/YjbR family)
MTIETVRTICRALPGTTEDIKWVEDLVFSVGKKMYAVVSLVPPHTVAFKCSPDTFAELVEREGIIPAPYLARAMWVQEKELGAALDRQELRELLRASYELVKAKLPKKVRLPSTSLRPGKADTATPRKRASAKKKTKKKRRR